MMNLLLRVGQKSTKADFCGIFIIVDVILRPCI